MQKTLLLSLLIGVCLTIPACKKETDPLRLERSVVPVSQKVKLTLDPAKDNYSGQVEIGLNLTQTTDSFRFHARDMQLGEAVLERGRALLAGAHRVAVVLDDVDHRQIP